MVVFLRSSRAPRFHFGVEAFKAILSISYSGDATSKSTAKLNFDQHKHQKKLMQQSNKANIMLETHARI